MAKTVFFRLTHRFSWFNSWLYGSPLNSLYLKVKVVLLARASTDGGDDINLANRLMCLLSEVNYMLLILNSMCIAVYKQNIIIYRK